MSQNIYITPLWPSDATRISIEGGTAEENISASALLCPGYATPWKTDSSSVCFVIDLGPDATCPIDTIAIMHGLDKATWRVRGAQDALSVTKPTLDVCGNPCLPTSQQYIMALPGYIDSSNTLDGTGVNLESCVATTDPLSYYYTTYYNALFEAETCNALPVPPTYSVESDTELSYYDSGPLYHGAHGVSCPATAEQQEAISLHNITRGNTPLRFWRIDIDVAETGEICLHKIAIGSSFSPKCNINNGWSLKYVSNASIERTLGGKRKAQCVKSWKEFSADLDFLSSDEVNTIMALEKHNGLGQEYLLQIMPCDGSIKDTTFFASIKEFNQFSAASAARFSKPLLFEEI